MLRLTERRVVEPGAKPSENSEVWEAVACSGPVAGDPELRYDRDGKPLVACRVVVDCRVHNEAGEWVGASPPGTA